MNKAKMDIAAAGCRWNSLASPELALSAQAAHSRSGLERCAPSTEACGGWGSEKQKGISRGKRMSKNRGKGGNLTHKPPVRKPAVP
jgi:hypothetical protein